MSDILHELLSNGFMIYPSNGKFILKKEICSSSPYQISEREFNTYKEAMQEAELIFKTPQTIEWTVLIRYNRGLGIEYKNLETVFAVSYEAAKDASQAIIEEFSADNKAKVAEVRKIGRAHV